MLCVHLAARLTVFEEVSPDQYYKALPKSTKSQVRGEHLEGSVAQSLPDLYKAVTGEGMPK